MKCFYHGADLDGQCSAAILKYVHPECDCLPVNYGQPFPWDTVTPDEVVWMVDFSLSPFSEMLRLDRSCLELVWVDHHKTAIDEWLEAGRPAILGLRDTGRAACELVWEYAFPDSRPTPHVVRHLGRYDVWDHQDPLTVSFQYGMRAERTDPENQALWRCLFEMGAQGWFYYSEIVRNGNVIVDYERSQHEKVARARSFAAELDGLKLLAVNQGLTGSKVFDSVWDPERYDAMCTFQMTPSGKWSVSLYTDRDDVDVSQVARRRGGGGHRGAAGFLADQVPVRPVEAA